MITLSNTIEFVDLGLPSGTLWAKSDLGSNSENISGDYIAYGELLKKDSYSKLTYADYKLFQSTDVNKGVYNTKHARLTTNNDAAAVRLGKHCHIPDADDISELYNKCDYRWEVVNGNVQGIRFYKKGSQKLSESVFFKANGYKVDEAGEVVTFQQNRCLYWMSDRNTLIGKSNDAYAISAFNGNLGLDLSIASMGRYFGMCIRPVYKNNDGKKSIKLKERFRLFQPEYVDLGLPSGNKWAKTNIGAVTESEPGLYFAWAADEININNNFLKSKNKYYNIENNNLDAVPINGAKLINATNRTGEFLHYSPTDPAPITDTSTILLGKSWRMFTKEDFNELQTAENIVWEYDGDGYKVYNKADSSKYIYFSFTGYKGTNDTEPGNQTVTRIYGNDWGCYWTSEINTYYGAKLQEAYEIQLLSDHIGKYYPNRYSGIVIRPIYIGDGSDEKYNDEVIDDGTNTEIPNEIDVTAKAKQFTKDGRQAYIDAVDLGLPSKTLWASYNIGATSKIEVGEYIQWGCSEEVFDYSIKSYKWYDENGPNNFKYLGTSEDQTVTYSIGGTEYDGATIRWGGPWKMPTCALFNELRNNCTWTWKSINYVKGYEIIGPNGNSIFLPCSSYMYDAGYTDTPKPSINHMCDDYGMYWSDEIHNNVQYYFNKNVRILQFKEGESEISYQSRNTGLPIRPICNKMDPVDLDEQVLDNPIKNKVKPFTEEGRQAYLTGVDLGLASRTIWASYNIGASKPSEIGEYIQWGCSGKVDDYSIPLYKWYDESEPNNLKYLGTSNDHTVTYSIAGTEYDTAVIRWGGPWQMPSRALFNELRNSCEWTWETVDNIKGYKVKGPNGNSIFLPCSSYMYDECIINYQLEDHGYYWSDEIDNSIDYYFNKNVRILQFKEGETKISYQARYVGLPIRPVYNVKADISSLDDPDDPGTDNPGTDDPGTDNPGTDDPGTDDPGTDNPGTDNTGTVTKIDTSIIESALNKLVDLTSPTTKSLVRKCALDIYTRTIVNSKDSPVQVAKGSIDKALVIIKELQDKNIVDKPKNIEE